VSVEAQAFKDALARWASGVTIVTTVQGDFWKGTTVSAFTSVSLNPPLVMIGLVNRLFTRSLIAETGVFAVNILGIQHEWLAKVFAGTVPEIEDRFAQATWTTAVTGSPILSDANGWVDCIVTQVIEAGDHTLFLGEVQAAGNMDEAPLLYYHREWGEFEPFILPAATSGVQG
jgi:flavin reductase (DIM6/NTAB) family NADH-FMN oxidoreductase RutF